MIPIALDRGPSFFLVSRKTCALGASVPHPRYYPSHAPLPLSCFPPMDRLDSISRDSHYQQPAKADHRHPSLPLRSFAGVGTTTSHVSADNQPSTFQTSKYSNRPSSLRLPGAHGALLHVWYLRGDVPPRRLWVVHVLAAWSGCHCAGHYWLSPQCPTLCAAEKGYPDSRDHTVGHRPKGESCGSLAIAAAQTFPAFGAFRTRSCEIRDTELVGRPRPAPPRLACP